MASLEPDYPPELRLAKRSYALHRRKVTEAREAAYCDPADLSWMPRAFRMTGYGPARRIS